MDWLLTLSALAPVVLPLAFFWANCPCCGNNGCADVCSDQGAGDQLQVTMSGIADGSCVGCGHYNNTFSVSWTGSGTLDTQCNPATAPCCLYTSFGGSITCGGNDKFARLYRVGSEVGATWQIGFGNAAMAFSSDDVGIGSSLPEDCENISGANLGTLLSNTTGCDVSAAVVTMTEV